MIKLSPGARSRTKGIACKVETGRALAIAGLHPGHRRLRDWNCAPATCCWKPWSPAPGVTLKSVATAVDVPLKSGHVRWGAEGDLDFRGTLGVDKESPGRICRDPSPFRRSTPTRRRTSSTCS
jgi:hypothetical protein